MKKINNYIQEKLYIDKDYKINNDELYKLLNEYQEKANEILYIEDINNDSNHGFYWKWQYTRKEVVTISTNDDIKYPYTIRLYDSLKDEDYSIKLNLEQIGPHAVKQLTKYLKSYLGIK